MTSYVVLKKREATGNTASSGGDNWFGWKEVGPPVESISAEAAIRKAVDGDKGGTFVAVPIRSWAPVTVTVETKRTLKLA